VRLSNRDGRSYNTIVVITVVMLAIVMLAINVPPFMLSRGKLSNRNSLVVLAARPN